MLLGIMLPSVYTQVQLLELRGSDTWMYEENPSYAQLKMTSKLKVRAAFKKLLSTRREQCGATVPPPAAVERDITSVETSLAVNAAEPASNPDFVSAAASSELTVFTSKESLLAQLRTII